MAQRGALEVVLKTRVVRYWGGSDWLYRVDVFRDISATEIESNERIERARAFNDRNRYKSGYMPLSPNPLAYLEPAPHGMTWREYVRDVSRDRAASLASRLALALPLEDADVIAEFGEE